MDFMKIVTEALTTGVPTEDIVKREKDAALESSYMDAFVRILAFVLAAKILNPKEIAMTIDIIHEKISKKSGAQDLEVLAVFARARQKIITAFDELIAPIADE
jgi:hypothetical protein